MKRFALCPVLCLGLLGCENVTQPGAFELTDVPGFQRVTATTVSTTGVPMVDLGTLGGATSQAYDVNNARQVVGVSATGVSTQLRAFLWEQDAGMLDLGTLGGEGASVARAINDLGQVVGSAHAGSTGTEGFVWTAEGGMLGIGTLGGNAAAAYGINESGEVAGESYWSTFYRNAHGFFWNGITMIDVGTLDGGPYDKSIAYDLSTAGKVVGWSDAYRNNARVRRAFLWESAAGMRELGTITGGRESEAHAINASGSVVGWSNTAGGPGFATLWRDGEVRCLGTLEGECNRLGSRAWDINDRGQVVGESRIIGSFRAFLWEDGTGMVDLGTLPGGGGSLAHAINENGVIAGMARTELGDNRAVLWLLEQPVAVVIDIKPGADPNTINCANPEALIPVALQTTVEFDASAVDHTTVTFQGAREAHVDGRSGEFRRHAEDVDGDGDVDLVFHFRLGSTDLTCSSVEGTLTGETFDGQVFEATDSVRMVGGNPRT